MASDQTKQPDITHTFPTKPGEVATIVVGQGVSGETFMQYLLDNGLARLVVLDTAARLEGVTVPERDRKYLNNGAADRDRTDMTVSRRGILSQKNVIF